MSYSDHPIIDTASEFENVDDVSMAQKLIRMAPRERADFLLQLRAHVAAGSGIWARKRASLWNAERKLSQIDRELRSMGR